MITRFSNAVRRVIYVLECPMHVIASGTHIGRATLSDVMHGRHKAKLSTAQSLVRTLNNEINHQVQIEQAKIDKLKELKAELAEAFDEEYKGGAVNGG